MRTRAGFPSSTSFTWWPSVPGVLSIVTNHDEEENAVPRDPSAFVTLQRASNLATGPGFA